MVAHTLSPVLRKQRGKYVTSPRPGRAIEPYPVSKHLRLDRQHEPGKAVHTCNQHIKFQDVEFMVCSGYLIKPTGTSDFIFKI